MAEAEWHYSVGGLRDMIDALRLVERRPSFRTTARLETVLQTAYGVTQANVHVITGRLKASGRTKTDFDGDRWTGEIIYGGPSNSPAYYGLYEMHREGVKPGFGPHDFFDGLQAFDSAFENAIDSHFSPLRGRTRRI